MTNPYEPPGVFASSPVRSNNWRWFVCFLLLLATVVNYMDRLTVSLLSGPIQAEFKLNNFQYGKLETGFGLAFATGSLVFGAMVDRMGVYWLYPVVLVGWSTMGFLTGRAKSYEELMFLRTMLGFFEAGHFPCGLKTVQQILAPKDRDMGNSMLQSGTALGAILAPQAIILIQHGESDWRNPFLVIGAGGTAWVLLWLLSVRPSDLKANSPTVKKPESGEVVEGKDTSIWPLIFSWRFLALAIMVVCINLNWHLFRVWMPKFLVEARGYRQRSMLNFTTCYYVAADVGILTAGFVTGWLTRRGISLFSSRMWVFGSCCLLTMLTTAAAFLPRGPLLIGALLIVAFGGLGTYAAYYSLTQELSRKYQGTISGALATITWLVSAGFHPLFGHFLDTTNNFNLGIGVIGWMPVIALVTTLLLWNLGQPKRSSGVDESGNVR